MQTAAAELHPAMKDIRVAMTANSVHCGPVSRPGSNECGLDVHDGTDAMSESSPSAEGSAGSFFGDLDREDRRRARGRQRAAVGEAVVTDETPRQRQEWKPQWIQTCEVHKGEWIDVSVRLPDPCPQCKQADGHGQKARIFPMPIPGAKEGDHILFDREFVKQKRSRRSSLKSLKQLNPFRN